MNPYKNILKANLPRLFSLYNLDPLSSTYGFGDRLYWGWKISDFVNGTFQGGVHALAIALKLGLIEKKEFGLKAIDSAIRAIVKIRARNGSLVEAFPNENSFCVTALVAFDVLSAIRHLEKYISAKQKTNYLNIVRPLVHFITQNSERHAIISNHLAAGVAAIELWNLLSGERLERGKELLGVIYRYQSEEGWYKEYEGADPGYQTLCTYHLFCAYEITKNEELLESLERSGSFLKYFVHPDGTIGGLYGSRNTEVYYPGGVVPMASVSEKFALIAGMLHKGVLKDFHIRPQDIDIGNFTPLLNSYALAALHYEKCKKYIGKTRRSEPYNEGFSKTFDHAGIYVQSTSSYYAIVNYKKGGTLKVFNKETGMLDTEDGGIFGLLEDGRKFSTQQFDPRESFDDHSIQAGFYMTNEAYLSPKTSLLLRVFGLTLFYSVVFCNLFKKRIVRKLITGKRKIDGKVFRKFEFLKERIIVHERVSKPKGCKIVGHIGRFKALHMASSGYYLKHDQIRPSNSKVVDFRRHV